MKQVLNLNVGYCAVNTATPRAVCRFTVAAAVLAGGAGRRMGGADKAMLEVGGITLLDRVLGAVTARCDPVVVVGPTRRCDFDPAVTFIQESPPGGGPVPAVGAAISNLTERGLLTNSDVMVVVAVDFPLLSGDMIARLVAALDDLGLDGDAFDASAATDSHGRANPLLAAYRVAAVPREFAADRAASSLLPPRVRRVDLGPESRLGVNDQSDLIRARAALSE